MTLSKVMTAKPTTLRDTTGCGSPPFHTRKIDDLIVVNAKREPVSLISRKIFPS